MTSLRFIVPKDWVPHIPDSFGGERKKRYEADRQAWVMDSIIRRMRSGDSRKGVAMNANVMLNVLGSSTYQDTIGCMTDSGCIKTNNVYKTGHFSRRYRLMVPLDRGFRVVVPTNPFLTRAVTDWKSCRRTFEPKPWLDIPSLRRDLARLRIDGRAAWRFIRQSDWSFNSKNVAFATTGRLGRKNLRFDKYGRVHSWATSLKSELRQFLSLDGEKPAIVDVANSQPLLLAAAHLACTANGNAPPDKPAAFLRQHLEKIQEGRQRGERAGKAGERSAAGAKGVRERVESSVVYQRCLHILDAVDAVNDERGFRSYLEMCEDGLFYDGLAALCDTCKTPDFKVDTFRLVFFANSHGGNDLWRRFKTEFPAVSKTISLFHHIDMTEYGAVVEKCSLSTYLQTLESEIVLGTAYPEYKRLSGGAPAVTIHDCLMVPQRHVDHAREAIRYAFGSIGLGVTVS